MSKILKNKYFAAVFVLVVFQWLAVTAFLMENFSDSERRRSKAKAVSEMINWLVEKVGNVPASVILSLAGIAGAYYVYKRMERLAARLG